MGKKGGSSEGKEEEKEKEEEEEEEEPVMLRVDVLKSRPPPSALDFAVAARASPLVSKAYEERFPEMNRGRGRRFLVYALQVT